MRSLRWEMVRARNNDPAATPSRSATITPRKIPSRRLSTPARVGLAMHPLPTPTSVPAAYLGCQPRFRREPDRVPLEGSRVGRTLGGGFGLDAPCGDALASGGRRESGGAKTRSPMAKPPGDVEMGDMRGDIGEATVKRAVLLIATLTAFLTPFMASSINIALPAIERDFRVDAVLLAWIATSFLLPAAVLLLPFGRLADIHGRKKIFGWGIVTYAAASVLCGLSPSIASLIAFRVLQGVAGAMIFSTGVAMLTSVFPVGERGKALGLNVAAVYLGLSLGPPLGGVLTQFLGWRSVFLVNAPLGVIIIALILRRLKGDWAEARGERFDLAGTLLYILSLTLIMYGVPQLTAGMGPWLVAMGLLGFAAFLRWEQGVEHPILDVTLLKGNAVFTYSNLAALINYSATFAVTFLLSLYLQYTKG